MLPRHINDSFIILLMKTPPPHHHFINQDNRTENTPPSPLLTTIYKGSIKRVLTSCITIWYINRTISDHQPAEGSEDSREHCGVAPLTRGHLLQIMQYLQDLQHCANPAPTHMPQIDVLHSCHSREATTTVCLWQCPVCSTLSCM